MSIKPLLNVNWHLIRAFHPKLKARAAFSMRLARKCFEAYISEPAFMGTFSIRGAVVNVFQPGTNTNIAIQATLPDFFDQEKLFVQHTFLPGDLLLKAGLGEIDRALEYSVIVVHSFSRETRCPMGVLQQLRVDLVEER